MPSSAVFSCESILIHLMLLKVELRLGSWQSSEPNKTQNCFWGYGEMELVGTDFRGIDSYELSSLSIQLLNITQELSVFILCRFCLHTDTCVEWATVDFIVVLLNLKLFTSAASLSAIHLEAEKFDLTLSIVSRDLKSEKNFLKTSRV